jgi:hypothetical protein
LAGRLLLFQLTGGLVLVFAFLTVHRHPPSRLQSDPGATRSSNTITWWHERGYFASGGLIALKTAPAPDPAGRAFYRSSTGGYMVSGYVVEKIALLSVGRYSWRLLAIHNQVFMLITSSLLALLVFRAAMFLQLALREALCFAVAAQAVFLTFPIVLSQYWELSPQLAALPFALIFLLLENEQRNDGRSTGPMRIAQSASAFLLVYMESFFGVFFLLGYMLYVWLVYQRSLAEKSLLAITVLPAALAFVLFAGQMGWARASFPDVPFEGSGFLFRTGLDGSTTYYADYRDIALRRDLARSNFPVNRERLFRWPVLFVAGSIAAVSILIATARGARTGIIAPALVALLTGYVLYAALFTQAVVIHPYLYDPVLFTPLAAALFGFAPSMIEARWRSNGIVVLFTLILAACCSLVQLRQYAVWYPAPADAAARLDRGGSATTTFIPHPGNRSV